MKKRVTGVKRYPKEAQEAVNTLIVNEIYETINGEGPLQGLRTVILRLMGCNLRCSYCDSAFAYNEGERMTFDEVLDKIKVFKSKRVLVTGGEPLCQRGTIPFIKLLLEKNYEVSLETNGTFSLKEVPPKCLKVVDVKTTDSGFEDSFQIDNLNHIKKGDCLKFVIGSREGYLFSKKFITQSFDKLRGEIYFSPVYGKISYEEVVKWILEDNLDVRFSLQIHKIIWGEKRGF